MITVLLALKSFTYFELDFSIQRYKNKFLILI